MTCRAPPPTDREQRVLGHHRDAPRASAPKFRDARITMAHGAGGKATQTLIEGLLVPAFGSAALAALADAGAVAVDGVELAFTTDSFVVKPIRFPGGSIGELAVNGTVNDLAVAGARPLALTLSLVLEEGLAADDLRAEVEAIAAAAAAAGVEIVAGDTKVVERGHADSMYLCTTGIGQRRPARARSRRRPAPRRPDPRLRARSASTARRSCSRAASSSSTPTIESDTRSLWPAVDALLDAAGRDAALPARRDPRRRRLGAERAGARLGGGDGRARGATCRCSRRSRAPPSCSGSTRCTSRTRASSSPSSRPERADAALAALRAVPGLRAGGRDRRGQDRAAGDGAGRDGVRRQAGDGPARRRPAAADLLSGERRGAWPRSSSFRTSTQTEEVTAHVLWMTTGPLLRGRLGRDDLGHEPEPRGHHPAAIIPGMPRVVIHNQVLAYEDGQEFIAGLVSTPRRASSTRSC